MNTRPVHILLVEDDDVDVMAVKRALRAQKIANPLTVARDGLEALDILRGQNQPPLERPYLILLDINMPRMNGLELLAELRADPALRSSIVFMLTTSAADADKAAAYDKNIAGYIVKNDVGRGFVELVGLLDTYWRVVEMP